MVQKPTKVKYDVSEASSELLKLNKDVKKAGDVAKKSFDIASKAGDFFTQSLGAATKGGGKLVAVAGKLGVASTAAAAGLGAVALAGASLASNFLNLPELLKDTNKQLDLLKAGGRSAQDFADSASAIGDALALRTFTVQRREIQERSAALVKEQVRLDLAVRNAQELIEVEKLKFSTLDRIAKTSTDKRISIEQRLKNKRIELADDSIGAGRTGAGAIADLTGEAKKAARGGDVDRAEALVERAKALSKELGNHAFFTNQIDSANNEILRSLEKQTREAKSEEKRATTVAGVQDATLKTLEARKKALDVEFAAIARNQAAIGGTATTVGLGIEREVEAQNAEQAARDIRTARKELERLQKTGKTLGDILSDFARGVPQTLIRSSKRAAELAVEFSKIGGAAIIAQGIMEGTPESLQRAGEEAKELKKTLSDFRADPSFPAELSRQADRLESLLDTVQRASIGGATAVASGVGFTEDIESGAERVRAATNLANLDVIIAEAAERDANASERTADAEERAATAIERRAEAFAILTGGVLPNAPATAPVTPDVDAGTAPAVAARGDVFTFNFSVKGGIIDRELTEQIADIANREFRKLTATRM